MQQLQVKVARRTNEASDIVCFELRRVDGGALAPFAAGAHVDVHIAEGVVRQYSLCNPPGERDRYVLGVLRDPASRGGSAGMHDHVREGDLLWISEPKNHFPLVAAERSLLFAGGIGITPILCMAEHLAAAGEPFELHYCARSAERAAFRERITASPFATRVRWHFDDGPAEQRLNIAAALGVARPGTHVYICGPTGFIDFMLRSAREHGWRDEQLHMEHFGAVAADSAQDSAFDVEVRSTGDVYRVPPGRSITDVLAEHGVDVPVSCEQGVCGTCVTRVLDGEPDHRDLFFTEAEHRQNDQITPCCSRACSARLVLDL